MTEDREPIDIGNIPDLLRIVEDVQRTQQPQVLRVASEDVAAVVPLHRKSGRSKAAVDADAVLSAAGSWKDLADADELKAQLAEARGSNRTSSAP